MGVVNTFPKPGSLKRAITSVRWISLMCSCYVVKIIAYHGKVSIYSCNQSEIFREISVLTCLCESWYLSTSFIFSLPSTSISWFADDFLFKTKKFPMARVSCCVWRISSSIHYGSFLLFWKHEYIHDFLYETTWVTKYTIWW